MSFPLLVGDPSNAAWPSDAAVSRRQKRHGGKCGTGVMLCAAGFVKKIVHADNVAGMGEIRHSSCVRTGALHCLAIYDFAIQIYLLLGLQRYRERSRGFSVSRSFQNCKMPY